MSEKETAAAAAGEEAPKPGSPKGGQASLYEDEFLRIEADAVVVKWYYFPMATSKRIKFAHIVKIEDGDYSKLPFTATKMWGMALTPVWWPCDMKRPGREHYILLHLNTYPSCGLTLPNDRHAKVLKLLRDAWQDYLTRPGKPADAGEKS